MNCLKNMVGMPFYLHNSALRQLQHSLSQRRESLAEWKERFKRQDTFHGSYMSLRDSKIELRPRRPTLTGASGTVGTRSIGQTLLTDDYFSNMNPRLTDRSSPLTLIQGNEADRERVDVDRAIDARLRSRVHLAQSWSLGLAGRAMARPVSDSPDSSTD